MEVLEIAESEITQLQQIARELRRKSLELIFNAGSGHPGGSLSAADIVSALYFGTMNYDPRNPTDPKRDRFILSKGHCTALLYSTLARAGYFAPSHLLEYRKIDSQLFLSGHPHPKTPGVEIATGSLGQGLSVGHGIALASKLDNLDYKVYVLLGDGELQEGQIWETAMTASHFKTNNLIAIVDFNKVAQDNLTNNLKNLEPLDERWHSFGWETIRIDGHDMQQIIKAFRTPLDPEKPRVIIANTVKGKGVSFMENKTEWHGVAPSEKEYQKALKELE
tara:strand:+ start:454 stop:1287 length:834 start_codon:yes stop_codon:yes gene_type:complete